jgi:hypothetical protein
MSSSIPIILEYRRYLLAKEEMPTHSELKYLKGPNQMSITSMAQAISLKHSSTRKHMPIPLSQLVIIIATLNKQAMHPNILRRFCSLKTYISCSMMKGTSTANS